MELARRGFLTAGLGVAASGLVRGAPPRFFDVHPFIRANPKAVFVRRTNVAGRLDHRLRDVRADDPVADGGMRIADQRRAAGAR